MKKLLLFLIFGTVLTGLFAQDTVVVSYTIKSGLNNQDTVMVYMKSDSSNTINIHSVDMSFVYKNCAAKTTTPYSFFYISWSQLFPLEVEADDGIPSVTYNGVTYNKRYNYSNTDPGLLIGGLSPIVVPASSAAPGLLVLKVVLSDACSSGAYLETKAENATNTIGDNNFIGIPFKVVAFSSSNLPVTYSSFQAKAENNYEVRLSWETQQEINNDYFVLEKSYHSDFSAFSEIAQVTGAGTTDQAQAYQFLDASPMEKHVYYRLRQVDFDGSASLSNTLEVTFDDPLQLSLHIGPNPTSGPLTIDIEGNSREPYLMRILSITGQVLQQRSLHLNSNGYLQEHMDLGEHPAGMYILEVVETEFSRRKVKKLHLLR